jgi:hypothetical protein
VQLCKIDAKIMRSEAVLQQLELKFKRAALIDFQTILLPLLKSFLRVRILPAPPVHLIVLMLCDLLHLLIMVMVW